MARRPPTYCALFVCRKINETPPPKGRMKAEVSPHRFLLEKCEQYYDHYFVHKMRRGLDQSFLYHMLPR